MSKLMSEYEVELMIKENMRQEAAIAELRAALRQQEKANHDQCWSCEKKRRWIGALLGMMLANGWALTFPSGLDRVVSAEWINRNANLLFVGVYVVLLIGPLVCVWLRWRFLQFKRREAWKRWPVVLGWQAYRSARKRRS